MGSTFAEFVPEVIEPVASALRGEGYADQADALRTAVVERWTYDPKVNAGYIYLAQDSKLHHAGPTVANTLVFMFDRGFNVDLGYNDELLGVELLEHRALFGRLGAIER